jgi:hypothetical protein
MREQHFIERSLRPADRSINGEEDSERDGGDMYFMYMCKQSRVSELKGL